MIQHFAPICLICGLYSFFWYYLIALLFVYHYYCCCFYSLFHIPYIWCNRSIVNSFQIFQRKKKQKGKKPRENSICIVTKQVKFHFLSRRRQNDHSKQQSVEQIAFKSNHKIQIDNGFSLLTALFEMRKKIWRNGQSKKNN